MTSPTDSSPPLPRITPETGFFWTAGATGRLSLLRCESCGRWLHPPTPDCLACGSSAVSPQPVSGHATVWTYTVNYQPFLPSIEPPYALAIVALDEQDDLHLTTRIVGCDPESVHIGMRVQVQFDRHGDVYLPLFAPETGSADHG